ncbi:hypothetical protein PGB28_00055 [Primorskyibacter aestuariivivens]|uniref:hypothetical protein n=1 Tax=Primorskyibacter aestuariivivens TaxID=1888912 RepID=UPI002300DBE2|nr:hypothetical protein [Primorskyibacter aestuariivivens]MDA7426830.1 hypothetical protein [Primorskyibacter aestuariivivens]
MKTLLARGWAKLPHDPRLADWAARAAEIARDAIESDEHSQQWQCDKTWFVGVDVLHNAPDGSIGDVSLAGRAVEELTALYGAQHWHRAQVSVVRPGYPKPRAGESDAAFRYRQHRDAAHVDGLLPVGDKRRRHLHEPHGFILGIPLNETSPDAAPLVVWDGSHLIMKQAFEQVLGGMTDARERDTDVTDAYQSARRRVFDACPRLELHARPGEALILHRQVLHGIAGFADTATAPPEGRMIAYFRPQLAEIPDWLALP